MTRKVRQISFINGHLQEKLGEYKKRENDIYMIKELTDKSSTSLSTLKIKTCYNNWICVHCEMNI